MTDNKSIMSVSRRLDATNVADFKSEAMKSLDDHEKGIILNFTNTIFIDSAGLGALVSILKAASQSNKKVILTSLTPQVHQIFELTKLYRIFDICDTVPEAEAGLCG